MTAPKQIIFTVTNDLNFDQRMIRICRSLAAAGYQVTLIGRQLRSSPPLIKQPFHQIRLRCIFKKGFAFYAEYNFRLFFRMLFTKVDCICAIDLDTIIPVFICSYLKRAKRVYDAHELFCEMKEVVTRPSRYKIWKWIEKTFVPHFKYGYTVCGPIALEFKKLYKKDYPVIRNLPYYHLPAFSPDFQNPFFLYQGAVNEGRSFETLIPAMKRVNAPLHIYGDGNFLDQVKVMIHENDLGSKVLLKGKAHPEVLRTITASAFAGITLFENNGLSNYYSLANRFFDYIMAGIPQVCVDYPAYREINQQYEVALLIADTSSNSIQKALNLLLSDSVLYQRLQQNCILARNELTWQQEEKKLINFYQCIEK
jgi:glycosyltransferase involved in cell wall biosynthesis